MENKAKVDYHCLNCLILSQRCRTKFHAFETVGTGEPRILKECTARHKFANQDMMIKHVPEKLSNKLPQESGADESREVLKNISMNGI